MLAHNVYYYVRLTLNISMFSISTWSRSKLDNAMNLQQGAHKMDTALAQYVNMHMLVTTCTVVMCEVLLTVVSCHVA